MLMTPFKEFNSKLIQVLALKNLSYGRKSRTYDRRWAPRDWQHSGAFSPCTQSMHAAAKMSSPWQKYGSRAFDTYVGLGAMKGAEVVTFDSAKETPWRRFRLPGHV